MLRTRRWNASAAAAGLEFGGASAAGADKQAVALPVGSPFAKG